MGKVNLHGGVETPPYRARVRGCSTARSRQDKIARAAYRPPLRPNGKQICRARVLTAPGRSLAGVVLVFAAQRPVACRGGVYAARGMSRQAGNLRARQNRTAGASPRPTGCGNGDAPPRVHGKIKLHGRPAGRPYDRTYICNLPFLFAIYARSLRPPAKAGGVSEREPG